MPEQLVVALQGSENDAEAALTSILEAGLQVLEMLLVSTPRKQRKAVKEVCEALEIVLEELDADLIRRLASCEAADLTRLSEKLCAVQVLRAEEVGMKCVTVVQEMLDEIGACGGVVAGASRQLGSTEATERMHGLVALATLARVLLPESVPVEIAAASLVLEMATDRGRKLDERAASLWGLYALFSLGHDYDW